MKTREVFISYARASAGEAAHALLDTLQQAGVDTYLETEEIPSGAPFPKHLAEAMRASQVVVIFADSTYFTRPWCVYEFLVAIAPYRQEPDGKDVLEHVVIGLGADVDTVLPHLPPPLAQVSWPALAETESMKQLVIERLRAQETTLGQRLAKLDDAVVDALAGGGAIPATQALIHIEGETKAVGPRYLESLPDSLQERFFGRRAELWELFHVLETRRAGGVPASCLVEGVDGLGKTQLVAEYVWRYGDRYPGGIVWIDASDEEDLARQLDDVGKQFGDDGNGDFDQLVQQAAAKGHILWVVDQLPEPEPGERPRSVATWCPAHHHITLLATSQRTGIREFDEHVRLSELNVDDAVALLTRAPVDAAAIDHFGWTDLVYWIGCMPLALESLHESLAEGMASADVMLTRARSDEPSPQLDEGMAVLAEDLPAGALRGIYETFQITYANLAGRPEMLRAAHRLAWLRAAPMHTPWIDSLVDAPSRTLLSKRSWLDYRPGWQGDHASWRMHRIVGSFLRTCSPDPDGELVEVFNWLRDACVTATPSETYQLDRHASTLYQRVFVLAERNGSADLRCIQAAADAAAQLVVLQLDDFERRGTRYLSAQFMADIGAGASLVELLRDHYGRESDAAAKSIAALLSALTGVREAAEFCAEILSDAKDDARWQAYMSAASLGFPDVLGIPYIDCLIKEENENIRRNMQTGFENMFSADGSGLDPVLTRLGVHLESTNPRDRAMGVALVGRLLGAHSAAVSASSADPTSTLRRLALQDPDPEVGELAARKLASVDDTTTYDLLAKQLKESVGDPSAAAMRLCAYLNELAALPPPQVEVVDRDEGMEFRGNFFPKAQEVKPELYSPLMTLLNDNDDPTLAHTILCNMTSRDAQLALVDEAHRLLDAGENEHVLQFADQVSAAQKDLVSVAWWRGQAYEALNKSDEAISAYTETLTATPEFYDAAMRRGSLLHLRGQQEQALEDLNRVVVADSEWGSAWYIRCAILTKLGRYDEALDSIDRALELASDVAEYHYWRGTVCQRLNRWDEALTSITEALVRAPGDERFLELETWLRSNQPKEI